MTEQLMGMLSVSEAQEEEVILFPLSYAQQRMWFFYQTNPVGHFYNVPLMLRLTGALDADLLRCGLAASMARH